MKSATPRARPVKPGPLTGKMVPRLNPGRSVLRITCAPSGYAVGDIVIVRTAEPFGLSLIGDDWSDYNPTRFEYLGELSHGEQRPSPPLSAIRLLALGGWLLGPVPERLALAGVSKLLFDRANTTTPVDYDVIRAITPDGPFEAHVRVGRSELAPWCQFVGDLPGQAGPRESLAEAIVRLEDYLTGETAPVDGKDKT